MNTQKEIQSVVTPIKEGLRSTEKAIYSEFNAMETKAELTASRFQAGFRKAFGESREMVHRHPLTAVLIGVGAGCLIGAVTGVFAGRHSTKTV